MRACGLLIAACIIAAGHAVAEDGRGAIVASPRASTLPISGCQPATFKVAIDIGHDKLRPGVTSARGVSEFTYNQALGELVLNALKANGFTSAFLIGESGVLMPLLDRPRIARDEKAAVFISLHHDSAQKQYFSEWTFEGRRHAYSDTFHGYSIFVSQSMRWAKDSLALATLLGQALKTNGLTPSLHHAEKIPGEARPLLDPSLGIYAFDGLAVLRGATMPALLLESGLIVNRSEEQAIQSGNYHPRIVAALVSAIANYCARH